MKITHTKETWLNKDSNSFTLVCCFKKKPKLSELLLYKVGVKKTKEKVGNKIPQVYKSYFYGVPKNIISTFLPFQILGTLEEILIFPLIYI
jgi:hypothetical protein